jgi:nucleoid-associated protein YgaU
MKASLTSKLAPVVASLKPEAWRSAAGARRRTLLLDWQAGNPDTTPYICRADAARIVADIASLEFHDSLSSL